MTCNTPGRLCSNQRTNFFTHHGYSGNEAMYQLPPTTTLPLTWSSSVDSSRGMSSTGAVKRHGNLLYNTTFRSEVRQRALWSPILQLGGYDHMITAFGPVVPLSFIEVNSIGGAELKETKKGRERKGGTGSGREGQGGHFVCVSIPQLYH